MLKFVLIIKLNKMKPDLTIILLNVSDALQAGDYTIEEAEAYLIKNNPYENNWDKEFYGKWVKDTIRILKDTWK